MNWKPHILIEKIKSSLQELADEDRQKSIWMGTDQSIVILPWEVHYDLISGSHFDVIKKNQVEPVISSIIDSKIEIIANKFADIIENSNENVELMLENKNMAELRCMASDLLKDLSGR